MSENSVQPAPRPAEKPAGQAYDVEHGEKMKCGGISKYKLNKIATESLRNAIRLHFDAILLYEKASYPSAFQLSV